MKKQWHYLSMHHQHGTLVWTLFGHPEAADLADLPHAAEVFLFYDDEFRVLRSRSGVLFNSVAAHALREKLQANANDLKADPFAMSIHR